MMTFLKTLDAEEERLVEMIAVLESGAIETRPPRPPVSEIIAQSRVQLERLRSRQLAYEVPRTNPSAIN